MSRAYSCMHVLIPLLNSSLSVMLTLGCQLFGTLHSGVHLNLEHCTCSVYIVSRQCTWGRVGVCHYRRLSATCLNCSVAFYGESFVSKMDVKFWICEPNKTPRNFPVYLLVSGKGHSIRAQGDIPVP